MNKIDICQELHQNFIDFAYEANSQRAFPDARDGLKPGQRACLWEMFVKGYSSNKPHVKSAKIDGGTAATWWPHGTTAIYETFARMSQSWINNIPEVDWHGSNGNAVIGSAPAADRYTEARLAKATEEGMFQGIKKNTVPMILNFSEDEEWPEVLPAIFPRLMINGSQGIGVTVAQVWLNHNLGELAEIIEKYLLEGTLDYSNFYPDFPSGGIIINKKDIPSIYSTGKGKVILRGRAEIQGSNILITEFPYQVYVEPFIDEVKKLVETEELSGIAEIHNKSDKKRLLVEIQCEKDAKPQVILNKLYQSTSLQKNFNANQMALVSKTPKLLTLKDYLDIYINHNIQCIFNEYTFDLNKAKDKLEITNGLLKALEDIDNIIQIIKKSESVVNAKDNLITKYSFTENQAKAIVDMKLGKLAHLEYVELNKTKQTLENIIDECNNVLSNNSKQKEILLERLKIFVNKFNFKRRTEVTQIEFSPKEKEIENVVPEECVVVITESGLIKRIPTKSYRTQKRSGVGIKNSDDIIKFVCRTNTIDTLMVFSSNAKMYRLIVDNIPEGTNASKGTPIQALINMETGEKPMAYASLYHGTSAKYVFFATKNGIIKKVPLSEYEKTKKTTGIIALTLKEGDSLAAVTFIEEEEMMLITKEGMAIRFATKDMPLSSRTAQGVKGMKVNDGDEVLTCLPIKHNTDNLAIVSSKGLGKQIELKEFAIQNRGGKGLSFYKEPIAGVALVDDTDDLLIFGDKTSIRIAAKELPVLSRTSVGNSVIKNNSKVVSISKA